VIRVGERNRKTVENDNEHEHDWGVRINSPHKATRRGQSAILDKMFPQRDSASNADQLFESITMCAAIGIVRQKVRDRKCDALGRAT
jgi:hypothetical protein